MRLIIDYLKKWPQAYPLRSKEVNKICASVWSTHESPNWPGQGVCKWSMFSCEHDMSIQHGFFLLLVVMFFYIILMLVKMLHIHDYNNNVLMPITVNVSFTILAEPTCVQTAQYQELLVCTLSPSNKWPCGENECHNAKVPFYICIWYCIYLHTFGRYI